METNVNQAAHSQQLYYNQHCSQRMFKVGDPVWLSVPTAGKLQPRWEGNWRITAVLSPITVKISDNKRLRTVHINRVRHRIQPARGSGGTPTNWKQTTWTAPQTEHIILPPAPSSFGRRYPTRARHPPNYYSH